MSPSSRRSARPAGRPSSARGPTSRGTVVCILDAKRGDIGTTAERYAAGIFGHLDGDAVTLSPYLGEDAIEPFLAHEGRIVYVLARTSNPSASRAPGAPRRRRAAPRARRTLGRGSVAGRARGHRGGCHRARRSWYGSARSCRPSPFLVPGVGAQGGDLETAVRTAAGERVPGLVSISRGIAEASTGDDWRDAARAAARDYRRRMAEAVLHSTASAAHAADSGGS